MPPLPSLLLTGSTSTASDVKKGYKLPRAMMTNADVTRLINSDEVQSVVLPPKETAIKAKALKKNPLKNLGALVKLNPHAASVRRNAILLSVRASRGEGKLGGEGLWVVGEGGRAMCVYVGGWVGGWESYWWGREASGRLWGGRATSLGGWGAGRAMGAKAGRAMGVYVGGCERYVCVGGKGAMGGCGGGGSHWWGANG